MQFEHFLKLYSDVKHHALLFVSKQFDQHHFPQSALATFAEKFCELTLPPEDAYHPDVLMIDPNRNQLRLEDVEKIHNFCLYPPQIGKRRLILMENCERLNINSANSILKSLEEPPANILFLFTTAHPELILKTVLSRLQIFYVTFSDIQTKNIVDIFDPMDLQFIQTTVAAMSSQNIFFGKSLSDKKNFCAKPENLFNLISNCEQLCKKYTAEQIRSVIIYCVSEKLKTETTFIIVARFIMSHIRAWKRAEQYNPSAHFWLLRILLAQGNYENQ